MDYLDKQRAFWNTDETTSKFGRVDTVSANDEEYERLADEHFQTLREGIEFTAQTAILEIGCGVGRLLGRVATLPHARLIGVDIAANMVALAQAAVPSASVHRNSGADISMVETGSVDFAYSNDVFIHIADLAVVRTYLNEVARVLKPGGVFRFNVRALDLEKRFSNSPSGLLAKASYALGLQSGLHFYRPGNYGFSGLYYQRKDLEAVAAHAGLRCRSITLASDPSGGSFYWCDLIRR